jgi:hypothetical protein
MTTFVQKAACKMLVKLIPEVNFINIFCKRLLYKILVPKITKLCFGFVTIEKLLNSLLYKKAACKMLVKLTPGLKVINVLHTAFTHVDPEKKDSQVSIVIWRFWDLRA